MLLILSRCLWSKWRETQVKISKYNILTWYSNLEEVNPKIVDCSQEDYEGFTTTFINVQSFEVSVVIQGGESMRVFQEGQQ